MDKQLPKEFQAQLDEIEKRNALARMLGRVTEFGKSGIAIVRDRDRADLTLREEKLGARWAMRHKTVGRRYRRYQQRQSPSWRRALREATARENREQFRRMEVPRGNR